jgi:arylsulfatase A-like enzyme
LVRRCLAEMPSGERWLVVLTGSRGYALGEHGQIGGCEGRLFAEMLQIPLMLRFPDASGALARSQKLVSHIDLLPTLVEWIGDDSAGVGPIWDGLSLLPLARLGTTRWRDELVAANVSGQLAIRNSEWCLRREPAQSSAEEVGAALFVRPDDRYEVNDIASLCPEVVERLSAALDAASRNFAEVGDMLARDPSLEQRPQDIPL